MKVLVTGLTGRMTGSDRLLYKYDTAVYALLTALKDLGHDAEVKQITLGEDLSGYDCALVGLAPFNSLSSRHIFGALDVVSRMPKVAFYADDWSIVNMATGMLSVLREPQKRLFRLDNRMQREAALEEPLEKWTDSMQFILRGYVREDKKLKLLAPLFPWGDPKKLLPDCGLEVVGWDPSEVIAPAVDVASFPVKDRKWVLATLQDHSPWVEKQKLIWDVMQMGNKRAARQGAGDPFVSEDEVKRQYAMSWGVLSPQYAREDGTGWWRMRYLHARDAGSVLYCGPKVGGVVAKYQTNYNASSYYSLGARAIETFDEQQLTVLAAQQREELARKLWSRDRALQAVETLVQETARG